MSRHKRDVINNKLHRQGKWLSDTKLGNFKECSEFEASYAFLVQSYRALRELSSSREVSKLDLELWLDLQWKIGAAIRTFSDASMQCLSLSLRRLHYKQIFPNLNMQKSSRVETQSIGSEHKYVKTTLNMYFYHENDEKTTYCT